MVKNVTPQPASLLLPAHDLRGHVNVVVSKKNSLPARDLRYIITSKMLVQE